METRKLIKNLNADLRQRNPLALTLMEACGTVRPVEINEDGIESFLRENPLAVVDFWGTSCIPCRIMAPVMEELAEEYSGYCAFAKFRVDGKWKMVGRRYKVMSVPTLLVYKDGKIVKRMTGFSASSTPRTLRKTLDSLT